MKTASRSFLSPLLLVAFGLIATAAQAAPRDAAAKRKIDEAINTHYLTTDFDRAESVLLGTIQACGDRCSPPVIAKAWMYVGIVRGSGRNDPDGALEAFTQALATDPSVQLDAALATPETAEAFAEAKAAAGGGATPAPAPGPAAEAPPPTIDAVNTAPAEGNMLCTPSVREVQTNRPIPISCETTQASATRGVLFYKEFGSDSFAQVPMQKKGTSLQATVPCSATSMAGKLQVYVEARDAKDNVVDNLGTRPQPMDFSIVGATSQPPPAFPGQDPPPRCEEAEDCPPDFPGCSSGAGDKEWGDSCASNDECQTGLCSSGSCDYCSTDDDCGGEACNEGFCAGSGRSGPASGPMKKFWFGAHFAADLAVIGGKDICTLDSQTNKGWNCTYQVLPIIQPGETPPSGGALQYPYEPSPVASGKVNTGLSVATMRALLSFDYALNPKLTAGLRAGFAFNGGPQGVGSGFLPVHAELRFAYWFAPLNKPGLRPYVHLGAGLGQVDAKVSVKVLDCNAGLWYPAATYEACLADPNGAYSEVIDLYAYRRMGQLFVAPGAGMVYAITPMIGVQANVDAKVMVPTTGFAVSPSVGVVAGF